MDDTSTHSELIDKICEVRGQVADVLLQIDDAVLQQSPRIRASYTCLIGCHELELFTSQVAARRARRRLEMAQATCAAGNVPQTQELEAQLDEELADWEHRLDDLADRYVVALDRLHGSKPLSPSDAKELKRLHRTLIKRLHPDVCTQASPREMRLFQAAQSAYSCGDLAALRSLEVATRGMGPGDDSDQLEASTADMLSLELESALAQLTAERTRLEEVMAAEPFPTARKLEDPEWVAQRVNEIAQQVEDQNRAKRAYDTRYHELMRKVETRG